ncbi:MAG: hypothetical protein EXR93_12640 [Gemmatimonadetes bacterium]|nr:hypothetical protein [Gemmatimonadota bacterium]
MGGSGGFVRRWALAAGVAVCLPFSPPALAGPASRIEGHVRDEVTGTPVTNARVNVAGTSNTAVTDSLGAYALERVQPGRISLRVQADGFGSVVQDLTIEPASTVFLQFEVAPFAVLLDRLTVRGASPDRATEGKVVTERLKARVPGARVLFSGGAVGMATQILLRGVKSMNLPGEPLYYMDGIRMSPPTAPSARNRGGESSILDLIDPASIERIEVISGAAANAAFGLGSNNGVILIYTKR